MVEGFVLLQYVDFRGVKIRSSKEVQGKREMEIIP